MTAFSAPARLLGCLCSVAAFAFMVSGCANKSSSSGGTSSGGGRAPAANAITIGEYGSLTGDKSTFGHSTDNGVELAVKGINAAGGVNGHPLNVDVQDDAGTPDGASSVVKKIITSDKPAAVIGEVASTLSIQAAPICNAAKVPMISPSSTNPKVTQLGPYVFRVCFIDPFQGTAAAKFALGTLHAKKAAILTDAGNDYSIGLTKFFTQSFTQGGGAGLSSRRTMARMTLIFPRSSRRSRRKTRTSCMCRATTAKSARLPSRRGPLA